MNYDGAYFADEVEAGISVVVRNELGQVMASLAEKLVMLSTVELLKAMAARIIFDCSYRTCMYVPMSSYYV